MSFRFIDSSAIGTIPEGLNRHLTELRTVLIGDGNSLSGTLSDTFLVGPDRRASGRQVAIDYLGIDGNAFSGDST